MSADDRPGPAILAALAAPAALAALALGLAAAGACAPAARPGTAPRHVLLITVDTLRADHLSAYLYPRTTSCAYFDEPQRARGAALSIDDLAASGVLFTRAFAPRGQTIPSLATLMTGRPPLEHGLLTNEARLPEAEETLAELFRARGFATAAFTANALLAPESGLGQGFDVFEPWSREQTTDPDSEVVKRAWEWVQAQDVESGPPLFLWLHFIGPHLPYEPLPLGETDYATLFTDPDYDGPANGSREFLDAAYAAGLGLPGLDVEQVVALYDGEIGRVNHLVRTFLQLYAGVFDESRPRLLEDTALVFTADHGEELYQRHGYWAHSKSVYDSVLHVPLVLRHPASLTGRRVLDELVELQDLLPTLCEWFGIEPPARARGRSLLSLTDARPRVPWVTRPAFATYADRVFSVRTEDWRFVWNPDGIEPDDPPLGPYPIPLEALFEHAADRLELHDAAAARPDVVSALRRELERWLAGLELATPELRERTDAFLDSLRELGYAGDPPEDGGDVPGGRARQPDEGREQPNGNPDAPVEERGSEDRGAAGSGEGGGGGA